MPNKHPKMRLSREEETFLRRWMYDEMHFQEGIGPAKQLQVAHQVSPANLALIVAAAFPELSDQEAAGIGPPPVDPLVWPWPGDSLHARLLQARAILAGRASDGATRIPTTA
jgi:hypothetical protein